MDCVLRRTKQRPSQQNSDWINSGRVVFFDVKPSAIYTYHTVGLYHLEQACGAAGRIH